MSKVRSALIALTALALATTSANAGGPRSIKDDPYSGINWSGFYVGIQGGYGWGDTDHLVFTAPPQPMNGGLFGVTVGVNWQRGYVVYGLEGDFSVSDLEAEFSSFRAFTQVRNLSTARARLGYAMDKALVYVTGGFAYGNVRAGVHEDLVPSVDFQGDDRGRFGWTLGGGIEWAFAPRWSVKAEYLRVDLGADINYSAVVLVNPPVRDRVSVDAAADIVRIGLNYNFRP
jgi:outer membrane immunogenic protein